jgi:NAD(P)H-dependent FMN reductase
LKILAILGSPRKGNTFDVLARVEKSMQRLGDVDFEYLFLGCFRCVRMGHEACPLKDDKASILDSMIASDGIILASPVYNYNITALMKNFIDRLAHIGHRPAFFKQHLMIVATTGGIGLSQVKTYLTEFVGKLWGFRSITRLGLLTAPFRMSASQEKRSEDALEKASKRFNARIRSEPWAPRFHHLEQFCLMRALWSIDAMKDAFPADHALYSSLRKKKFYFDAAVDPVKYGLAELKARFIGALVRTSMEKRKASR